MKVIVSLIFTFITLLGVVAQASNCTSNTLSSQKSQNSINLFQHQSSQSKNLKQDVKITLDCHQNELLCSVCHLGHCAFTLAPLIQFAILSPIQSISISTLSVSIFDFETSLFRPPIY